MLGTRVFASMRGHIEFCYRFVHVEPPKQSNWVVTSIKKIAPTELVARDVTVKNSRTQPNIRVEWSPAGETEQTATVAWIGDDDGVKVEPDPANPNPSIEAHFKVEANVSWNSAAAISGQAGPGGLGIGFQSTGSCTMLMHRTYTNTGSLGRKLDSTDCKDRLIGKSDGDARDGEIMVMIPPGGFEPVPVWTVPIRNGNGDVIRIKIQDPSKCRGPDDVSEECNSIELELPTISLERLNPGQDWLPDLNPWGIWTSSCFGNWIGCVGSGWPVAAWTAWYFGGPYGGGGGGGGTPWPEERCDLFVLCGL